MLVENIDQLRESRRHADAFFIFDALQALTQDFLDDHGIFSDILVIFPEIEEERHKR